MKEGSRPILRTTSATTRFACLRVPDLPWVAELRAHPELQGRPLAVTSGPDPRAEVFAVSPEAARAGVRTGSTVVHARAVCPELELRVASPALERAAREALLDVAFSFSPRATPARESAGVYAGEAAVFLDATGMSALFPSEQGFISALAERARSMGLPSVVALAGSCGIAQLAARQLSLEKETLRIVPVGGERAFLAPLSLDLLDPEPELADRLEHFGVRRIADLLRLPRSALTTRLGPEVQPLLALAEGRETPPSFAASASCRFEEALDLEFSVDRLEPLAFVLRGTLSRLTARLELRALGCGDLFLELALEGGGRKALRVGVAAPTRDVRVLLRFTTLALEAEPPAAAVEAVSISTLGREVRPGQLDLFRPVGPAPAVLSRTLAELESLCGVRRVGTPRVLDDHRPDVFAVDPFPLSPREPTPQEIPAPPLCVRALRPRLPAQVRAPGGRPEWIRSALVNGRVENCAGPWRISGAWWSGEDHFVYDHFDVQTSDGNLSRLRFDRLRSAWHIDAVYD